MKLLIDNYDSFTYNLYQLIGRLTPDVRVIKNDELTVEAIEALQPTHIILSPGPGTPAHTGVSPQVVQRLAGKVPILGVCMGLEVLVTAFGGRLRAAHQLVHGQATLMQVQASPLFQDCPMQFMAARYHSLVADSSQLPGNFRVIGTNDDQEIMAIEDAGRHLYGVQFHPESIMTPAPIGEQLIRNFLTLTA
ncbi:MULTISPECIES: anthranilate synthase component II [Lactiplantibacillus]|jgi:anthranilate synthase component 2|uniref:Aminodeoxychorismate/anthranilate synthase component II n=1 Tax=Lactiplantibacillus pentosus TaxID=1589 RepID=A0AAW8WES3_LACPE|nr:MULTISPECIES: aminodeoxychorismate/anthranilate synthase component II [Lactiplantibacillus]MBU7460906.1 aminodeoxychorismate/anthranilate synthase component II [Lactiplantibacillus pentosus]MBU7476252.1 aminodeoxychorismate/anthranilate synthase component II [Lactiplantibacillus pentosus]MBU7483566.1 aminodeoxychorismate/anthranilate synthase component II [Lactiplantibacillus sp. 30.2.29]MBU7486187.1 aminodeoxychorismate/anthranilate synthase component II [Lactiplantibacillus pentosus]MBU74